MMSEDQIFTPFRSPEQPTNHNIHNAHSTKMDAHRQFHQYHTSFDIADQVTVNNLAWDDDQMSVGLVWCLT